MKGPIISVDVSNGNSHYQAFKSQSVKFGRVKKINHDIDGFNQLLEDVKHLEETTKEEVSVVYEATGVYTAPLRKFLLDHSIKQYVINPLQSAKKRKETIHHKKTDKLDPLSIAKVYYDDENKNLTEYRKEESTYHFLRNQNRLYEDRLNHLRKYKVSFQNILCICFPGYLKLFKDGYSDISMTIIR